MCPNWLTKDKSRWQSEMQTILYEICTFETVPNWEEQRSMVTERTKARAKIDVVNKINIPLW